jgi:hypothetical protein
MEIVNLIQVAITLGIGMFIGAGIMFRIMYKENEALEKELDIRIQEIERYEYFHENFYNRHMIEFAKFNTKHYDGCKNVKDKLKLYLVEYNNRKNI